MELGPSQQGFSANSGTCIGLKPAIAEAGWSRVAADVLCLTAAVNVIGNLAVTATAAVCGAGTAAAVVAGAATCDLTAAATATVAAAVAEVATLTTGFPEKATLSGLFATAPAAPSLLDITTAPDAAGALGSLLIAFPSCDCLSTEATAVGDFFRTAVSASVTTALGCTDEAGTAGMCLGAAEGCLEAATTTEDDLVPTGGADNCLVAPVKEFT